MSKQSLIIFIFLVILPCSLFLRSVVYQTSSKTNLQIVDIKSQLKISQEPSISDTTPPLITRPADINYLVNATGNIIEWYLADTNPGNYSIQHNYLYIDEERNKSWTENKSVSISVDNLSIGIHLYTILIEDTWGNKNTDDVLVTVREVINKPNFNYTTTNQYNLAEISEVLLIVGINIAVIVFISFVIFSRNRFRKKRIQITDLPPKDPLELEKFVEEDFI